MYIYMEGKDLDAVDAGEHRASELVLQSHFVATLTHIPHMQTTRDGMQAPLGQQAESVG